MDYNANKDTDEISLLDLAAVLWRRKILIVGITSLISIAVFIYVLVGKLLPSKKSFMPDVYTSTAFMRIQSERSSSSGTLASILQQSNLGNLAGLAGGGGNTNTKLALYIAGSISFLDAVADEFNIVEKYKIEKFPKTTSRRIVKQLLNTKMDDKSGVFSIAVTHTEPEFAQQVVLFAVRYYQTRFAELGLDTKSREKENLEKSLVQSFDEMKRLEREARNLENKIARSGIVQGAALAMEQIKREIIVQEKVYTQLKAQYEVAKIEIASKTPLFQVLDYPEVPERKSGPSRAMICIIAFAAGLFFSIFLAFLLDAIQKARTDFTLRVEAKQEHQDEK